MSYLFILIISKWKACNPREILFFFPPLKLRCFLFFSFTKKKKYFLFIKCTIMTASTLSTRDGVYIGVRARSDLGGRRPVCPKKLRSAPLLDCRNQLFTPSKCTKKHAFTIVERHKIVRNRNTVFRTSHTLCRFTRCSNDRVTKQATRSSN